MNSQEKIIQKLYYTLTGRLVLKILVKPDVSKIAGALLNTHISALFISGFVKRNKINMSEYEKTIYKSYNDFFTRKIKKNKRPVCMDKEKFISPCDSRLSAYPIEKDSTFCIKDTKYTLNGLLKDKKLAEKYEDGTLLLFRLSVDDYHRYCYIDDGLKSSNVHIDGVFHTVNPMANDCYPIYKENTREYCILNSHNFGKMIVMEVGAMLVGKIINYDDEKFVRRGEEKGRFEFGGSTIIVILKKDVVLIDENIVVNTLNGIETRVKMGQVIGRKSN